MKRSFFTNNNVSSRKSRNPHHTNFVFIWLQENPWRLFLDPSPLTILEETFIFKDNFYLLPIILVIFSFSLILKMVFSSAYNRNKKYVFNYLWPKQFMIHYSQSNFWGLSDFAVYFKMLILFQYRLTKHNLFCHVRTNYNIEPLSLVRS